MKRLVAAPCPTPLALVWTLLVAFPAVAQVDVSTAVRHGGGDGVTAVATGDFNGDGIPDLAVSEPYAARIAIRLGRGDGTFGDAEPIPGAASWSSRIAVADFDRDGHEDLATPEGTTVHIYSGDGTGRFVETMVSETGSLSQDLAVADLNNDGRLDIVTSRGWVLLNRGLRLFHEPFSVELDRTDPLDRTELAIADYDGDGNADIAFPGLVLLGRGDGRFGRATRFEPGGPEWAYHALASADFNEDGDIDLVVFSYPSGEEAEGALILFGDGTGDFSDSAIEWIAYHDLRVGEIADLNGDGHVDLLLARATHALEPRTEVLLGDGQGTFSPRTVFLPMGEWTDVLDIADYDGDGHLDVCSPRDGVSVVRGRGDGSFVSTDGRTAGAWRVRSIAASDMNEDGRLDAVVALNRNGDSTGPVIVFLGDGAGGFSGPGIESEPWMIAEHLAVGDFNEDGHEDALTILSPYSPPRHQGIWLLPGDGSGALGPAVRLLVDTRFRGPFVVDDFDRDGHRDFALRYSQNGVYLYRGHGDGEFSLLQAIGTGNDPSHPAFADFDHDGDLDLVYAWPVGSAISAHFGDGTGTYGVPVRHAVSPTPREVAALDFNGDGDMDVVALGNESPTLTVLFGDGMRGFSGDAQFEVEGEAFANLHVTDMGGDGVADLVFVHQATPGLNSLGVVTGTGAGESLDARRFQPGLLEAAPAYGDFDGDGRTDVVVATQEGARFRLSVLRDRTSDYLDCRRGNVNGGGEGDVADVLLLNGSAGQGSERLVEIGPSDAIEIRMELPPSLGTGTPVPTPGESAPFALYAWRGHPRGIHVDLVPKSIGRTCMSTPLLGGLPVPEAIWNNIGKIERFGRPTHESIPAPSVVFTSPTGIGLSVDVFLQGLIVDPDSPSGTLAVTNGIAIRVR